VVGNQRHFYLGYANESIDERWRRFSVGNVARCPNGCGCRLWFSDTHLRIDCRRLRPNKRPVRNELYHQLNVLLSADQFIKRLTSLTIKRTPLTRVPALVCKLVNLNSLNLDSNNISALPNNCFSNMTVINILG